GSWSKRDTGLFGTGAGAIVDIRVDPSNPARAFAVGTGQSSVFYFDGAASTSTWTNVSGDLPTYLRFSTICVVWRNPTPTLYLGTSRGPYPSRDLGATWTVFGQGMPNTIVSDLRADSGILYAATFGRGAWAIAIKPSKIIGRVRQYVAGPRRLEPGDPVEG